MSSLICTNPSCRFVVHLGEGNQTITQEELVFDRCPECEHQWSSHCPFCSQLLIVAWRSSLPYCSGCDRKLSAEKKRAHQTHYPMSSQDDWDSTLALVVTHLQTLEAACRSLNGDIGALRQAILKGPRVLHR